MQRRRGGKLIVHHSYAVTQAPGNEPRAIEFRLDVRIGKRRGGALPQYVDLEIVGQGPRDPGCCFMRQDRGNSGEPAPAEPHVDASADRSRVVADQGILVCVPMARLHD